MQYADGFEPWIHPMVWVLALAVTAFIYGSIIFIYVLRIVAWLMLAIQNAVFYIAQIWV